jgi:hypothetical protein
MASGRKEISKDGEATRFPHNDPTKGGRKPSIRNELKALLAKDGELKIPNKQVLRINEDGSVIIKLPTQQSLAMKLISWAMSNKGVNSMNALKVMIEQIDGKPKQEVDMNLKQEQPLFSPKED